LHGTLTSINQDTGNVTYTPNQGFTGIDSFTFKINDGKVGSTNVGTVNIKVNGAASVSSSTTTNCNPRVTFC